MREKVDMSIAMRGQHPDPAIFADQAVAEREAFLLLEDVLQGVGRSRV